ncbi:hypothetical protein Tco_0698740 [Tanacetum coccineum]
MGRDTIQLEDAVSTISQDYLLEFSSEYFIPENLHPELPGPEDHIVDFPEGKIEQEIPMTDDAGATEATVEPNLLQEMISMGPTIRKRRRQGDAGEEGPKAPTKVLRKDHDVAPAEHSARGGKSLAGMSVDTRLALHAQKTQEPPIVTQTVNDPNPLLYAKPLSQQDVTQRKESRETKALKIYTLSSYNWVPRSIYQPGWGVPNSCRLDTPEACQDVVDHIAPRGNFSELRHLPNDEFLSQYNMNLARQVDMGSQLRLRFEQEAKLLKKSVAQVGNVPINRAISMLQAQVMGEKGSWLCLRSSRSMRMSGNCQSLMGLKYGMEHGKAGLELIAVEAYDPEADNKYVVALHNLKELSYPLIDELEQLKDAPLDVIMASLYLESDTGEDAPQSIRDLRPSSSQLKILVYPEPCREEEEKQGGLPYPWGWLSHHSYGLMAFRFSTHRTPQGLANLASGCCYSDRRQGISTSFLDLNPYQLCLL